MFRNDVNKPYRLDQHTEAYAGNITAYLLLSPATGKVSSLHKQNSLLRGSFPSLLLAGDPFSTIAHASFCHGIARVSIIDVILHHRKRARARSNGKREEGGNGAECSEVHELQLSLRRVPDPMLHCTCVSSAPGDYPHALYRAYAPAPPTSPSLQCARRSCPCCFGRRPRTRTEVSILVLGLQGSGKTTLLATVAGEQATSEDGAPPSPTMGRSWHSAFSYTTPV